MQTIIRTWCKRKHSGGAKDAFIIFLGILLRVKSEDYNYRTRTLEAFFHRKKKKKKKQNNITYYWRFSLCICEERKSENPERREKRK